MFFVQIFRFVFLVDCGHTVESKSLEKWMSQNDKEITLKKCPICNIPILKTQRFMNIVKLILKDISTVKNRLYREISVLNLKKNEILSSLNKLNDNFDIEVIGDAYQCNHLRNLWDVFCQPLRKSNHNINSKINYLLPSTHIKSLDFTIRLFELISSFKNQIMALKNAQMIKILRCHFVWLLSVAFTYNQNLSEQQIFNIDIEMMRGARILNLFEIMSDEKYESHVKLSSVAEVENLVDNVKAFLMSCEVYSTKKDSKVQLNFGLIKEKIADGSIISLFEPLSVRYYDQGSRRAQGHWVKCPKGHINRISEDEFSSELSCPDCKSETANKEVAKLIQ